MKHSASTKSLGIAIAVGRLSDSVTARMLLRHGDQRSLDLVRDKQGIVRKSQIAAIMATSQPMMIANVLNAAALVALETSLGRLSSLTLLWAAMTAVFACYGYISASRFKRSPQRETASSRAPGKIVISSCLLALNWCYPLLFILPNGESFEVAFILALTAGMICGGALALYPVPLAGLSYTAILSVIAFGSILGTNALPALPFGMVICALSFVIVFSVLRHTRMFLSELFGKLEAERQRDNVDLLLETFQGEGGQYLWRSDANLDLRTNVQPLQNLLGLQLQAGHQKNLIDLFGCAGLLDKNADFISHFFPGDTHNGESAANFEKTLRSDSGQVIKFVCKPDPGDHQTTSGYYGYIKDLTKETQAAEREAQLMTRDAMTGLLNYTEFNRLATEALRELDQLTQKAIFIFVDADNLKRTNDTFGHAAGDLLIQAMARTLEKKIPAPCHVARKGGDEFVALVLAPKRTEEFEFLAELTDSLNRIYQLEGADVSMSCCIGASIATNANVTVKRLELEADRALYRSKSRGNGQLSVYDEKFGHEICLARIVAGDIKTALQNHELSVVFQPIVSLETQNIVSAEALVRWKHPKLGEISPQKIVEVAQAEGLGPTLLEFILKNAAEQAKHWPETVNLSVNICSADLQQEGLGLKVSQMIASVGLSPKRLCLEITETELLLDNNVVQANLKALRKLGAKIALDDFGTGYSSLSYLGKYPIDILKIDKSLISNLELDRSSQVIVKALRDLAATKNLGLIAEGVETSTIAKILHKSGVPMAQGFLFHKPMTAKALGKLLNSQGASKLHRNSIAGDLLPIGYLS